MQTKLKTILSSAVALTLAAALFAGCGSAGNNGSSQDSEGAPVEATLSVAIVTSPSGVDDGSFNQDNYNGILSFIEKNPGAAVQHIQETEIPNSVSTVANIIADYDVVVTPGFQFSGISAIAVENPEKKFILVDSFPDTVDDQEIFDNVYAMTFAEQESGFFAGVAAALETKTNKVAVVNGIAYPSNVNYQYGFMAGVKYTNVKYGKNVECVEIKSYAGTDVTGTNVGGNYIGDFNDEATGKVVGSELIGLGCDIIFVAAGNSGNGVFTAAKESGNVFVIGCDVDQYDDGVNGDKNIILTSVLKVMGINVDRALTAINDGSFKGDNVVLGASTDSTGYVKASGRQQLSGDTLAKLDDAYALVKDGTIVPPGNFTEATLDSFPGIL